MCDMYAQDTGLRRKALSKIRRKLGDFTPILRVVHNALQTDCQHAVCAKRQSVRLIARMMSDMHAQNTALCRNAPSKIHRKGRLSTQSCA